MTCDALPLRPPAAAQAVRPASGWWAAAASLWLAACATPPAGDAGAAARPGSAASAASPVPAAGGATPTLSGFEQQQLDRAAAAARQGRLAEAALAWEVLTLLRPDQPDYAERLRQTRRDIDAAVADRLPRAAAAAKRGDIDAATQGYLGVLALDPQEARAADALRGLERERVRRNYLGKYSRLTLTRRVNAEGEMQRPDADAFMPPTPGAPATENVAMATPVPLTRGAAAATTAPAAAVATGTATREQQAQAMARRGELTQAIALLTPREPGGLPKVASERTLLADLHVQRAQTRLARDRAGALADLRRAVALDPRHARAVQQLRELEAAPGTAPATNGRPATAPGNGTTPGPRP